MVLVGSTVNIVDRADPILELEAKQTLLFTSSDWWDQLPIFRDVTDFSVYSEEKIFLEKQFLSQYFANLGYRDVEITEMAVIYRGKGLKKGPKNKQNIMVNYTVTLGEMWITEKVLILGVTEELKIDSIPKKPLNFSVKLQEEIEQEILGELSKKGYANAVITWRSRTTGEHQLVLEAVVDTNNLFEFGRIEFRTWDGRPHKAFIKEYQWVGDSYDPKRVQSLEEKLYSLSLYEDVEIDEILLPKQEKVDLLVRLKPIDNWKLSPIVGVASESTTWSTDLGLQWKFKAQEYSLFGKHQVGYRNYPRMQYLDFSHQGLATWQELELSRPIFSSLTGEWFVESQGIADAQIGYQDALVKGAFGLRWKPTIRWNLESALVWQQHYYLPMVGKEEMFQRWFGEEGLVEEVIQPEISLRLEYLEPNRTWMHLEVIPIGWCNDSRLSSYYLRSEMRIPLGSFTIRPRFQHGAVIWYDQAVDSLHNRFFLGGSQTVRGWAYRGVKRPKDQSEVFDVSRGGERMGMVSLELQYEFVPAFSVLGFADLGRVWETPNSGTDEFQNLPTFLPSVGVGILLPSPVGDVILAPAWQVMEPDLDHAPSKMITHFYLTRELGM